MWKVEVENTKVNVKSGVSARTGKPYNMRKQEAWAYCYDAEGKAHKHPQKITLTVPDDRTDGYPAGAYFVHPNSLYLDKWGQLSIKTRLMPLADFQVWLRTHFASPSSGPVSTARAA